MVVIVLKLLAPATATLGPWIPSLAGIGHALKVATYIVALGAGGWGGVWLTNWWHGDRITIEASNQRCADAISVATVDARQKALEEKARALDDRAMQIDLDESMLRIAIEKMEKDRNETAGAGGDGVLVRADDGWLQRWVNGGRPAAGSRR